MPQHDNTQADPSHYVEAGAIPADLVGYIEAEILPRYDHFDKAHRRDHADMVISQSLQLASQLNLRPDLAYTIAAYHDTGLCQGREHHHEVSAQIIQADARLRRWFTDDEITLIAQAAEDHRASSGHQPRSIYGRVVAEADRFIDPHTIIRRTIQYGLEHYPHLSPEEHYRRMLDHLHEKYGPGGYLHLWFPDSPNARRLEQLRQMMLDEELLRQLFDQFFGQENKVE